MITEIKLYKTSNGTLFDDKEFAKLYDDITQWLPHPDWEKKIGGIELYLSGSEINDIFNLQNFDHTAEILVDLNDKVIEVQFEYLENVSWTYDDVTRFHDAGFHWYSDVNCLSLSFNLTDSYSENQFKEKLTTLFQLTAKHFRDN